MAKGLGDEVAEGINKNRGTYAGDNKTSLNEIVSHMDKSERAAFLGASDDEAMRGIVQKAIGGDLYDIIQQHHQEV